jgi:hypothetical protein
MEKEIPIKVQDIDHLKIIAEIIDEIGIGLVLATDKK